MHNVADEHPKIVKVLDALLRQEKDRVLPVQ
jgi:hypothetical protein